MNCQAKRSEAKHVPPGFSPAQLNFVGAQHCCALLGTMRNVETGLQPAQHRK
jgi:hypothetical protein